MLIGLLAPLLNLGRERIALVLQGRLPGLELGRSGGGVPFEFGSQPLDLFGGSLALDVGGGDLGLPVGQLVPPGFQLAALAFDAVACRLQVGLRLRQSVLAGGQFVGPGARFGLQLLNFGGGLLAIGFGLQELRFALGLFAVAGFELAAPVFQF